MAQHICGSNRSTHTCTHVTQECWKPTYNNGTVQHKCPSLPPRIKEALCQTNDDLHLNYITQVPRALFFVHAGGGASLGLHKDDIIHFVYAYKVITHTMLQVAIIFQEHNYIATLSPIVTV